MTDSGKRGWEMDAELADLRAQGLWRELRLSGEAPANQTSQDGLLDFSSNDYLGLAASPLLAEALQEGVRRYGAGSGASRLVSGTRRPHLELEAALAAFKDAEAALTFSSGCAAALGVIPVLLGRGDTVILDKLCHASLVDAARLSGATIRIFPHNHVEKLERLAATAQGRVLIVTESIFSMDGDAAALRDILDIKNRHGAWLLLDEAHAIGVTGPGGRGLAAELECASQIELQMGTLSKAIGLSGGYLAAARPVIDLLINRSRSFIYTTAPPPALAFAALAALRLIESAEGDERRARLRNNVEVLCGQLGLQKVPPAAILPVAVGGEPAAVAMSAALRLAGFAVPAIRYPTVARGQARLRISLSATHLPQDVEALAAALSRQRLPQV